MSLTDIMSGSNLAIYPQIALVIFLCVFATVAARVFLTRRRRDEYARAAMLPLDNHTSPTAPRSENPAT